MSDKFYDFDKDGGIDDDYFKKPSESRKAGKKEFEIEIPNPQSKIKSTIPQGSAAGKRKKTKKLAAKKTFIVIGTVLTAVVVYCGTFWGVVKAWRYLPGGKQENSVVNHVKKNDTVMEVSDDGTIIRETQLYEDKTGDKSSVKESSAPTPSPHYDNEAGEIPDEMYDEWDEEEKKTNPSDKDGKENSGGKPSPSPSSSPTSRPSSSPTPPSNSESPSTNGSNEENEIKDNGENSSGIDSDAVITV